MFLMLDIDHQHDFPVYFCFLDFQADNASESTQHPVCYWKSMQQWNRPIMFKFDKLIPYCDL